MYRVYNCLKHWIQKGFYDFFGDEQLQTDLTTFLKTTMVTTGMENAAKQLQKMFDRQASGEENSRTLMFTHEPPPPYPVTASGGSLTLMDIHPEELARQLTLIEYELYKKIKPWECLNQSWAKKDKETRAPNILAMIQRFNQVSNWVATEIVTAETLKQRAKVLQHVIETAEFCRDLNNFNAMMEIISGLQNSAVFRLKQTWAVRLARTTERCSVYSLLTDCVFLAALQHRRSRRVTTRATPICTRSCRVSKTTRTRVPTCIASTRRAFRTSVSTSRI